MSSSWDSNWLRVDTPELQKNVWKSPSIKSPSDPGFFGGLTPDVHEDIATNADDTFAEIDVAKEEINRHSAEYASDGAGAVDGIGIEHVPVLVSSKSSGSAEMSPTDPSIAPLAPVEGEPFDDVISENVWAADVAESDVMEVVEASAPSIVGESEALEARDLSDHEAKNTGSNTGSESESSDDEFGDFEGKAGANSAADVGEKAETAVANLFSKSPTELVDDVYRNFADNSTEPETISTLLDYGNKTRKLYNSFCRPSRQFFVPEASTSSDVTQTVVRWQNSAVESELVSIMNSWENEDVAIAPKKEGTQAKKSGSAYGTMFGWSSVTEPAPVEQNKIVSLREKLEKRARLVADSLVAERVERERKLEEQHRRERELEREKWAKAREQKQKVDEGNKLQSATESQDSSKSSNGKNETVVNNIFSPFSNIFKFQKTNGSSVKLPSKAARNIKKSNLSSKDFFKGADTSKGEDEKSDSDDDFGNFVLKSTYEDEEDEEEEEEGPGMAYGSIGDAVDLVEADEIEIDEKEKKMEEKKQKKEKRLKEEREQKEKEDMEKKLKEEGDKKEKDKTEKREKEREKQKENSAFNNDKTQNKARSKSKEPAKSWFGLGLQSRSHNVSETPNSETKVNNTENINKTTNSFSISALESLTIKPKSTIMNPKRNSSAAVATVPSLIGSPATKTKEPNGVDSVLFNLSNLQPLQPQKAQKPMAQLEHLTVPSEPTVPTVPIVAQNVGSKQSQIDQLDIFSTLASSKSTNLKPATDLGALLGISAAQTTATVFKPALKQNSMSGPIHQIVTGDNQPKKSAVSSVLGSKIEPLKPQKRHSLPPQALGGSFGGAIAFSAASTSASASVDSSDDEFGDFTASNVTTPVATAFPSLKSQPLVPRSRSNSVVQHAPVSNSGNRGGGNHARDLNRAKSGSVEEQVNRLAEMLPDLQFMV